MAYGTSSGADEKLCRQFMKVCRLSGSDDKTVMSDHCSRNIRLFFWAGVSDFKHVDLKFCEQTVFNKLKHKKRGNIIVDGAHVEAYLTEMAHEITKQMRNDLSLKRDDPRVTLTKSRLENIIRETKIFITGTVTFSLFPPPKSRKTPLL